MIEFTARDFAAFLREHTEPLRRELASVRELLALRNRDLDNIRHEAARELNIVKEKGAREHEANQRLNAELQAARAEVSKEREACAVLAEKLEAEKAAHAKTKAQLEAALAAEKQVSKQLAGAWVEGKARLSLSPALLRRLEAAGMVFGERNIEEQLVEAYERRGQVHPTVVALLEAVRVASDSDDFTPGGCWDYIGESVRQWRAAGCPMPHAPQVGGAIDLEVGDVVVNSDGMWWEAIADSFLSGGDVRVIRGTGPAARIIWVAGGGS